MSYRIAAIDVHKRMLAVVVSDVEVVGDFPFERRQFGSTPAQLRELAEWLVAQQVEEVVMESTAQYWKPVWATLERAWKPLAQQRVIDVNYFCRLATIILAGPRCGRGCDSPT